MEMHAALESIHARKSGTFFSAPDDTVRRSIAMQRNPHCYLSMKDFTLLEAMLDQSCTDQAFARLLREKISNTTVFFQDEGHAPGAAIGTRVDFVIDGRIFESRVLVADDEDPQPSRLTLPITTLRGLALLGLGVGDAITIEWSEGESETLQVDNIYNSVRVRKDAAVVAFRRQNKLSTPIDPEDDPGPRAA
jgi:regulator of nucleoside diphosphate kinase